MNIQNIRHAAVVALTLATLAAPASAFAQDASTVNAADIASLQTQIQSLLSQVSTLKAQLKQAVGASVFGVHAGDQATSTEDNGKGMGMGGGRELHGCPMPNRNLGMGAQGDDVKELQAFLAQNTNTFGSTTPTGFFGPRTAEAMREFQSEHGIASSTTGFVGPMTRAFFGKRCGQQLGVGQNGSTTPMMGGDHGDRGRGPGGPGSMMPGLDQRGGDHQGGDN